METTVAYDNHTMCGNMSNTTLGYPSYYSRPYQVVTFIFVTIILIVGMLGNIMVVLVVSRTRAMHTPTNCYLVSLAVADIVLLCTAPIPTLIEMILPVGYNGYMGMAGCTLMVFSQYLGVNVSSLSITAFTIERYIAICHPMKAQTLCTVTRAKKIITIKWIFGILYCAPWLGLTIITPKTFADGTTVYSCNFRISTDSYAYYYTADLVLFYIIPLVLTCVLYGLIARILFTTTISATPGRATNGTNGKASKKSPNNSRVQVVKMLAIVVGMFASLWLPYRVYVVYNTFAVMYGSPQFSDLWFLLFARMMVYMNSAINPILYNAMSVKFRRAFKRLLYCGKNNSRDFTVFTQLSHAPHDHHEMR